MKDNFAVLIPSFNRIAFCVRAIRAIRKYDREIDIFVTVEQEQYLDYYLVIGRMCYVIPLPKKRLGAGYSIYYGFALLNHLGYRYVLRLDDDIRIQFYPKYLLEKMKRYKEFAWIAVWVSIYDLFYRGKEPILDDNDLFHSTTYCPSMGYIIDLVALYEIGGWDWRMRHLEDVCANFRFRTVYGYSVGVDRGAKVSQQAMLLQKGSGGIESDRLKGVSRRQMELRNIKWLQRKYGKNVIVKSVDENGKAKFNLRKLFDGGWDWNKKWVNIPKNFTVQQLVKSKKKMNRALIMSDYEFEMTDNQWINWWLKIKRIKLNGKRFNFADKIDTMIAFKKSKLNEKVIKRLSK